RTGVCIGSRVAPLLSDFLLGSVDASVKEKTSGRIQGTVPIFRYVDDNLVISTHPQDLNLVQHLAVQEGGCLNFTRENPSPDGIQFVDLKLIFGRGLCWRFEQGSMKALLPYSSCLSRVIKDGIVKNVL